MVEMTRICIMIDDVMEKWVTGCQCNNYSNVGSRFLVNKVKRRHRHKID